MTIVPKITHYCILHVYNIYMYSNFNLIETYFIDKLQRIGQQAKPIRPSPKNKVNITDNSIIWR